MRRAVLLALCIAAGAANGATQSNDLSSCAITATPSTTPSTPIGHGTYIRLLASCNADRLVGYFWSTGEMGQSIQVHPSTTTAYTVTAKIPFGAEQTFSTTVYIAPTTASFALSAGQLNFSSTPIGRQSGPLVITVVNPDSVAHVVSAYVQGVACLAIPSPCVIPPGWLDFQLTSDCNAGPIPPHGSCSIVVRFAPTGLGERGSSITVVQADAIGNPGLTWVRGVPVSGVGVAPEPIAVPVRFDSAERDCNIATIVMTRSDLPADVTWRTVQFKANFVRRSSV